MPADQGAMDMKLFLSTSLATKACLVAFIIGLTTGLLIFRSL
jgi:hypothetical protein